MNFVGKDNPCADVSGKGATTPERGNGLKEELATERRAERQRLLAWSTIFETPNTVEVWGLRSLYSAPCSPLPKFLNPKP